MLEKIKNTILIILALIIGIPALVVIVGIYLFIYFVFIILAMVYDIIISIVNGIFNNKR